MIESLLSEKEASNIITIFDSYENNGRGLLYIFINAMLQRYDLLFICCLEKSPAEIISELDIKSSEHVKIIDLTADPLGWIDGKSTLYSDITSHIEDLLKPHHKRVAVLFDSLTPLILNRSAPYTCQTLQTLSFGNIKQKVDDVKVLSIVHKDLHDGNVIRFLKHVSSSEIHLCHPKMPNFMMQADIIHKKISGKVIRTSELFNLAADFRLADVTKTDHVIGNVSVSSSSDTNNDPTANLTFNLRLTEKEKQARSEVNLPFMHHQQKKGGRFHQPIGEAKIFYQADEADDFDEEDPDDDLDI